MMNNKTTQVQESVRMFIGIEIPEEVRDKIRSQLSDYTRFTKKLVPEENWHVTILFIGDVPDYQQYLDPLGEALPQTFIPTISLTHIGRGLQKQQLWAFANATALLDGLQNQLTSRFVALNIDLEKEESSTSFVPHIKLGDLRTGSSNNLLADLPIPAVWRVEKLSIYRSELSHTGARYSVMGHINLA